MSTTTTTKEGSPLLTDEQIAQDVDLLSKDSTAPDAETPDWMKSDIRRGMVHARLLYEPHLATKQAEIDGLRDTCQRLVDDLRRLRIEYGNRLGHTTQIGIASLSLAKERGIIPSNT
jgi:hypothetical protein